MSDDKEKPDSGTEDIQIDEGKGPELAEEPSPKVPEDMSTLFKKKEEEARANYDRMLRVAAEFENYKKRAERERSESVKYANEPFMKALLPVLDNLERALEHAKKDKTDPQALIGGIEMVLKEFNSAMDRFGVKPIDASGKKFDPQHHEAVMVETNNELEDNTIITQLQKGYSFEDRLLRPAMVIVSKRSSGT